MRLARSLAFELGFLAQFNSGDCWLMALLALLAGEPLVAKHSESGADPEATRTGRPAGRGLWMFLEKCGIAFPHRSNLRCEVSNRERRRTIDRLCVGGSDGEFCSAEMWCGEISCGQVWYGNLL